MFGFVHVFFISQNLHPIATSVNVATFALFIKGNSDRVESSCLLDIIFQVYHSSISVLHKSFSRLGFQPTSRHGCFLRGENQGPVGQAVCVGRCIVVLLGALQVEKCFEFWCIHCLETCERLHIYTHGSWFGSRGRLSCRAFSPALETYAKRFCFGTDVRRLVDHITSRALIRRLWSCLGAVHLVDEVFGRKTARLFHTNSLVGEHVVTQHVFIICIEYDERCSSAYRTKFTSNTVTTLFTVPTEYELTQERVSYRSF